MATRGERNRNPLNLRPLSGGELWQGQTGVDRANDPTGAGYCVFASWAWGIRAAAKLLQTYQRKYGIDTIQKIIERWAPASDNNHVGNYVSRVCRLTGLHKDVFIDLFDFAIVSPLVDAMARVELGISDTKPLPYSEAEKLQGLELAGLDVPQDAVRTAPPPDPIRRSEGIGIGTVAAGGGAVLATIAESQAEIVGAIQSAQSFGDIVGSVWPWAAGLVVLVAVALVVVRKMRNRA